MVKFLKYHLKSIILWTLLIAAIGGGYGYWHYTHTPKYLLRKNIFSLAETVSKASDESAASTAFKTLVFSELLAPEIKLDVEGIPYFNTVIDRDELKGLFAQSRAYIDTLSITIESIDILYSKEKPDKATLEGAFKVTGKGKTFNDKWQDTFLVSVKAVLQDGKWRFSSFETMKPFRQ